MLRACRFFLCCLLMLTLPMQGVSAALMAAQLESSGQSSSLDHCHSVDDSRPAASHEQGQPAKAKACAACCAAMQAAMGTPVALPVQLGEGWFPLLSSTPPSFIPDGPEHPPRRFS